MLSYVIREATPDDAEKIMAFAKTMADEPNNMIGMSSAAEFTYTLDEERELLRSHAETINETWLIAESAGVIVANANCSAGRRGRRQTVSVGISIAQEWRNQGIGTAIMCRIVEWARDNPEIHRLELEVFTVNERAIHVYEKVGFQSEGISRQAFFKDGRFLDVLRMAILFDQNNGVHN